MLRLSTVVVVALLVAAVSLADPVAAPQVLRLGPLPATATTELDPHVRATRSVVPEVDPARLPQTTEAAERWQQAAAIDGAVALPEAGVWWLAARLVADRWSEVTLAAGDHATLYVDGVEVSGAVPLPTGAALVMARVAADSAGTVTLSAEGDAALVWDLEPRLDLSRFDRAREVVSIGPLAVAPRGKLLARYLSRRNPTGEGRRGDLSVFDGRGELVAADLGGPGARPVAFTADGTGLLVRRQGAEGADLLLWTAPRGPMRTVVTDEPELGLSRLDPSGRYLLLATTRGLEASEPGRDQRRWDVLRERVTDWNPRPHLQLLDLATGVRRVLTEPGDSTLDDAAWLPGGQRVVYARTLPQTLRPWFHTEIRVLDLTSGEDRLAATFTGGWEVRPQALTPHPDGQRLLFIGPCDQVGDGRPEHNVYQKQLWLLDLASGVLEPIARGQRYAYEGTADLPRWVDGGKRVLARASAGSHEVLVRLERRGDGWQATEIPTEGQAADGWALSPDGEAVAYVASGPDAPRTLWLQPVGGRARRVESPDRDLAARLELAPAEDAGFTGPGGDPIEAWWYRPLRPGRGPVPLIVYYYGGSAPTERGLNTTHQFWAANGYAVLVINPRGAAGYGQEFADWHAGDWGPAAGGDIIAGTEALLARHPELDPRAIGCYGGSYGGFMTLHLVTHSDLFAAAVSMYGIADLATYWGQGAWGWTYGDMAAAGRMPWEHPEYFIEHSPVYQAGNVQTPLLLLHGDADVNVTPGESAEMFTALQVQGKPVEMVTFAGEDHGIAGSWQNYVAHRTMMLEWFDRWLKGRPEAWEKRWE
ncbi:MAG: S9 family peptidase [Candidatus Krumholzibacteriia bacterium]